MINEIIREINRCMDNGCCIAGLSLALTLPDICGKAYYPELKNKRRYIKWFDEYIGQYEHDEETIKKGMPYLNGEIVYSLRCSLLHQGNPNIEKNMFGIAYFELLYHKDEGKNIVAGVVQSDIVVDEKGNEKAVNNRMSINVRDMCWKICRLASICYSKDKNKFNFFNYNLVDIDYHTRGVFGIKNRGDVN